MIFQKFFSKTLVLTNSKNLEDLNLVLGYCEGTLRG